MYFNTYTMGLTTAMKSFTFYPVILFSPLCIIRLLKQLLLLMGIIIETSSQLAVVALSSLFLSYR